MPFSAYICSYEIDGDVENWSTRKEEAMESQITFMSKYMTNVNKENIVGKYFYSPADWNNPHLQRGSMLAGDGTLKQMYKYRPFIGVEYKLPGIEGLYLTGSTCHPCGTVSGGSGYNAANVVAEDLKIRKWWEK